MYQIIHTKTGRKRGVNDIKSVKDSLLNSHAQRKETKAFKATTGELIGECKCINAEKDFWRVTLNGETIRESRALQLWWLEELPKLGENSFLHLNRPAHEVRAILKRKHPGKYNVDHKESGCQVYLNTDYNG